jgi:hypothetical protein
MRGGIQSIGVADFSKVYVEASLDLFLGTFLPGTFFRTPLLWSRGSTDLESDRSLAPLKAHP